jgi:hypothetical protein
MKVLTALMTALPIPLVGVRFRTPTEPRIPERRERPAPQHGDALDRALMSAAMFKLLGR